MKRSFTGRFDIAKWHADGNVARTMRDVDRLQLMQVKTEAVCDVDEFEPVLGVEILSFDSLGGEELFLRLSQTVDNSGALHWNFNGESGIAYFRLAKGRPRTQMLVDCVVLLDQSGAFVGFELPEWVDDYRFLPDH